MSGDGRCMAVHMRIILRFATFLEFVCAWIGVIWAGNHRRTHEVFQTLLRKTERIEALSRTTHGSRHESMRVAETEVEYVASVAGALVLTVAFVEKYTLPSMFTDFMLPFRYIRRTFHCCPRVIEATSQGSDGATNSLERIMLPPMLRRISPRMLNTSCTCSRVLVIARKGPPATTRMLSRTTSSK